MVEPVNSVVVVIASPGDAVEERAVVRDALNDWNIRHGLRQGVVLLPWLYERHAVPGLGARAQALINAQAVDRADVVVAFFNARLGTDTGVDVSGTAEEISKAGAAGKPVHVYFSRDALPRDADLGQLQALREFEESLREQGLLGEYQDPADLAGQVEYALQRDIEDAGWAAALAPSQRSGAVLSWEHVRDREHAGFNKQGKAKYKTTRNRLVVTNTSDVDAEDMTFELTVAGGGEGSYSTDFRFDGPKDPVTLHGRSNMSWLFIPLGSFTLQVDAEWVEAGIPKQGRWTVATQ